MTQVTTAAAPCPRGHTSIRFTPTSKILVLATPASLKHPAHLPHSNNWILLCLRLWGRHLWCNKWFIPPQLSWPLEGIQTSKERIMLSLGTAQTSGFQLLSSSGPIHRGSGSRRKSSWTPLIIFTWIRKCSQTLAARRLHRGTGRISPKVAIPPSPIPCIHRRRTMHGR